MSAELSGSHRHTYDALFRHPVAHNLHWRDVWSMLSAMSDIQTSEEANGSLKVTRNGQTLVLRRSRGKDLSDKKEVMQIRNFLERSEVVAADTVAKEKHFLVVINHRQARVYKTELHGSIPQRIVPLDASGSGRHLHNVDDDSNGQRKSENESFYESVAKSLQAAEKILLFGSGTGASSAMEHLLAQLNRIHKNLAKRIVGSLVVDEQHLSEDQLLAKAREFYATHTPKVVAAKS